VRQTGSDEPLLIVIISGATGRTAGEVVTSALAQFDQPNVRIEKNTNVRSRAAATRIVRKIPTPRAVIFHSLVSQNVRQAVLEEAQRGMIPTVDVLGPALAVLGDQLGRQPRGKPGLSYLLQKDYLDRMDAVSFTLDHDDGAGLATLHNADVVLVGVSRASKSVTCFYLAYRGVRAANVPLIAGMKPPEPLVRMPREKVIALSVSSSRLLHVRTARKHRHGGTAMDYYVRSEEIAKELRYAQHLAQRHRWRSIDVSYMAVEEVATQVLQMIDRI
jgi:regulator of PEP synthase PpsR (kinase-PPPase family)